MSFPREEVIGDVIGKREYAEYINWRVFKDLDSEDRLEGINVLMVLGNSWTIIKAADFRALAARVLPQLDG